MHLVKHISVGIMWANLNLLFWLSLIPFATGRMDEQHFAALPVAFYAMLLAMCGIAYTVLQKAIEACHKNDIQLKQIMSRPKTKRHTVTYRLRDSSSFCFC